MSVNSNSPLSPFVMSLIWKKTKQLYATYRFSVDDLNDLKQDITLEVLRRLTRITKANAEWVPNKKFLERMLNNVAARLVEYRTAPIRDYRRETRLQDCQILDEDNQWIPPIDILADVGRENSEEAIDLRFELKAAISTLPERLVTICLRLMAGHTAQNIADELNLNRSSIYDARSVIRKHFAEAGLEKYLEGQPDSFGKTPVINLIEGHVVPQKEGKHE